MLKSLTLIYILLLSCIVIGADIGALSPFSTWLHHIPFGDKTCHFVFVGILSFLLSATLSMNLQRRRKRTVVLTTIAILAVLTSLEEASQSMLAYRSFSEFDMLANVAGTCVFGSLAFLIPSRVQISGGTSA